ncbi:QueT transporter family protein [Cellulosilyticum sp. I15G10I2]|uniref:QueT transporter family protein n=1 Tax=Cellulosilyticum sp. I15G10I2 TaxID=1892843 RepID=UPI00114CE31F|nr:QueT transporter family protein [Cellulosilyticum sp. I15G10I2]
MKITTKIIVKTAAVAAIYTVFTLGLAFMSYGNIQFRVSEIMTLLAFFDPTYIGGLTLGCFLANLLGPNGLPDALIGTPATFISVIAIAITGKVTKKSKIGLLIASLWPTVFNGLIIGYLLHKMFNLPLLLTILEVAAGEFTVITLVGVPIFLILLNKYNHLLTTIFKNQ